MAEWTDERMDDLAAQMVAGFDRTDQAIRETRGEVALLRSDFEREIKSVRADQKADNANLRSELKADNASLRSELKADMVVLRTELKDDIKGLRADMQRDIGALHSMMFRFCVTVMVCMAGLAAALLGVLAVGPG